jgi:hypothetical protein
MLKNQVSCEKPGFFCFFNTDDSEMRGSPYMDNSDACVGNAYMDEYDDMDNAYTGGMDSTGMVEE